MGNFSEHLSQGRSNLLFLGKINMSCNSNWDWQVTACFYTALHIMSAHVVDKTKKNYLSHTSLQDMLNPYSQMSPCKLDEDTYSSYEKLYQLSRRSRYLLKESFDKTLDIQISSMTFGPHFKKAIYHLDKVLQYFTKEYNESFDKVNIDCIDLKNLTFDNFSITT